MRYVKSGFFVAALFFVGVGFANLDDMMIRKTTMSFATASAVAVLAFALKTNQPAIDRNNMYVLVVSITFVSAIATLVFGLASMFGRQPLLFPLAWGSGVVCAASYGLTVTWWPSAPAPKTTPVRTKWYAWEVRDGLTPAEQEEKAQNELAAKQLLTAFAPLSKKPVPQPEASIVINHSKSA